MKKSFVVIIAIIFASLAHGQKIKVDYSLDESDIKEMLDVLGVKCLKFEFPKELQGRKFKILIKEYHNGELIWDKNDLYINEINEDVTGIKAIIYKETDSTEMVSFRIPPIQATEGAFTLKYDRDYYAWTSLIGAEREIDPKAEIPFLTFTYAPTLKDNPNYRIFCALSQVANDYENWHESLSVKHFFIFILKFDEI